MLSVRVESWEMEFGESDAGAEATCPLLKDMEKELNSTELLHWL